jgi:voltage-gated potassium channel
MIHRRFLILLVLLGLLVVVHPIAMRGGPAYTVFRVLLTAVFAGALWIVFRTNRSRAIALILGVPVMAANWANESLPEFPMHWAPFAFNLLAAVFLSYAVAVILREVYLEKHFSREAIYGAICGYLLIGTAFGHMFYCADWLAPADFSAAEGKTIRSSDERSKQALFTYFSFAALTGVNDPDLTSRASAGRSLVLLEAVLGQFYVVVVISELITLRMSNLVPGGPPRDQSG